ncbi:uncharacterized protein J7T54_003533 [Emericellopsis cladophorae]|uniref:Uncharacterized protein n=1 Tax=Emericellopsis cladophorae TaxID=2686198 RepID=A0A9Q0B9C0_9HYPO|nr:uncharacterized protein J7T54_003533 [Emericellopsis cladophorae]KAI6777802.1 hypothetical protein J7T54_003533 [Emericellopsis cladophorae]
MPSIALFGSSPLDFSHSSAIPIRIRRRMAIANDARATNLGLVDDEASIETVRADLVDKSCVDPISHKRCTSTT